MTNQSTVDVAGEIRGLAAKKRIRQNELAEILHTSRMAISRRLNGSVPFTADELIILAQAMNVRVGVFFGEVTPSTSAAFDAGVEGVSLSAESGTP